MWGLFSRNKFRSSGEVSPAPPLLVGLLILGPCMYFDTTLNSVRHMHGGGAGSWGAGVGGVAEGGKCTPPPPPKSTDWGWGALPPLSEDGYCYLICNNIQQILSKCQCQRCMITELVSNSEVQSRNCSCPHRRVVYKMPTSSGPTCTKSTRVTETPRDD